MILLIYILRLCDALRLVRLLPWTIICKAKYLRKEKHARGKPSSCFHDKSDTNLEIKRYVRNPLFHGLQDQPFERPYNARELPIGQAQFKFIAVVFKV